MTLPFAGFPARTFKLAGTALIQVLAGLRTECDRKGRYFKSQRTFARDQGIPLSTVNWAIARAATLGILTVIPSQSRRKPATLVFADEHLAVTPEKPPESPIALDTKSKAREVRKKESPPVSPPVGGDAELPLYRDVGEQEAPRTEAEPIEAAPDPAPGDDPPAAADLTVGYPIVKPAEEQARPYRYRQRQPGDPPKPRRKRRRALLSDNLRLADEIIAEMFPEAARAGLPSPEIEILPPHRRAAVRQHDGPSGVLINLWLGAEYALRDWIAEHPEENPDFGAGDDVAQPLLATGTVA